MLFVPPVAGSDVARIVFIRRSSSVGSHRGQIGFPGGRADEGDESPADTALRELAEELGVPPSAVTTHGTLPPAAALDGAPVIPVVASAAVDPASFTPSEHEVAAVLVAPWTDFAVGRDQAFRFNLFGNWRTSHRYTATGFTVWGLTAGIIARAALSPSS
jgi:8-oxo-dGTP pyrophosphatase MutT (NUDIX family)